MKKIKTLAVFLTVCLVIILITHARSETNLQELSSLSKEESKRLREFFDHHFFFSDFAYTLFGTKPMSIGRLPLTQKAKKGWEAWEKISGSFRSKEFIIRKYLYNEHEFILVANLKRVEQIYHQNESRFKDLMSSDALIACLREDGPLFQELMHNHLLVGILLGYGSHNAELFANNQKLPLEKRALLHSFSGKIHPFFYLFSETMPVSFACDPTTKETKELKEQYREERRGILQRAKKDPLFFQMLDKLREG